MSQEQKYSDGEADRVSVNKTDEVYEVSVNVTSVYTVYRRRWVVLTLYVLFCICNALQWIQYAIITDIVQDYYNVDSTAVNWTSLIWMVDYIILIFPAMWLLNIKGLRFVIILGQALNCVGAWIKVASVKPDLFWVTFLGQTVVSTAQVYVMGTPAAVAATWFSAEQVNLACAIGVFGFMVGNAVGSVIPPVMVKEGNDEQVGADLSLMFYIVAGYSTVLLILIIIFFKDKPPTPPSATQESRSVGRAGIDLGAVTIKEFSQAVNRMLLRLSSFLSLTLAYGISVGVFSAIMTFLNQMILLHYEDDRVFAGNIGATFIICGLIGALISGYIMDRTHKYKETCFVLYSLSCVGSVGFTVLLWTDGPKYSIYLCSAVIGFSMIGYLPTAVEFGSELTYPEPEATSNGILSFSTQIFALIFTLSYGAILNNTDNDGIANGTMCIALFIGSVLSGVTKSDLRRQKAEMERRALENLNTDEHAPPAFIVNHS